jgi:hypothetical protein
MIGYCSLSCQLESSNHSQELCQRLSLSASTIPILVSQGSSPGFLSPYLDPEQATPEFLQECGIVVKDPSTAAGAPWLKYFQATSFVLPGPEQKPLMDMVPGFIGAVADGLSDILTLCYAVESAAARSLADFGTISAKADKNDGTFTIHIIGAETEGMHGYSVFEEILHRFPAIEILNIHVIGPGAAAPWDSLRIGPGDALQMEHNGEIKQLDRKAACLCQHCSRKVVRFVKSKMPYEAFVVNTEVRVAFLFVLLPHLQGHFCSATSHLTSALRSTLECTRRHPALVGRHHCRTPGRQRCKNWPC